MQINSSHMQTSRLQYTSVQNRQQPETADDKAAADGKEPISTGRETAKASEDKKAFGPEQFTTEELKELEYLKKRDIEVRAHELAHVMAGGIYVSGGARLQHEKGPDGKNYAVAGEVSIDSSKISGDPEATARKMQIIRRAALAPASPSSQDRMVAAQASQLELESRAEITLEQALARSESGEGKTENSALLNRYSPSEPDPEKGTALDIAV